MTLQLHDIPSFAQAPPAGPQDAERRATIGPLRPASRRSFLRGAVVSGMGLGLSLVGAIKLSAPAFADGYDIHTDATAGPCGPSGYAAKHNCDPVCGPSPVCREASCCTPVSGLPGNWHKASGGYSLRPNQCWARVYDGWNWSCNGVRLRCHDGNTNTPSGSYRSICRYGPA